MTNTLDTRLGLLTMHVSQDVLDTLVNYYPPGSIKEVSLSIEHMKLFWNKPVPPKDKIFGFLDVKKFARWIGEQKVPIWKLRLRNLDSNEDFLKLIPHLKYLDLTRTKFSSFELLAGCQHLEHLIIPGSKSLTLEHLKKIPKPEKIKSLNVSYCQHITEALFEWIPQLKNLEFLTLSISPNQKLPPMPNLKFLEISHSKINSLESISELTTLSALTLSYSNNLQHVAHLSSFTKLEHLNLNKCVNLAEDAFKIISSLKIDSLALSGCNLNAEELECIGKISSLQALDLSCSHIKDEELIHLEPLHKLIDFNYVGCTELSIRAITDLQIKQKLR